MTLDEYDLRDVQLRSLGQQIGMVTQETFLFHVTIRENLTYGWLNATDEEVIAATSGRDSRYDQQFAGGV